MKLSAKQAALLSAREKTLVEAKGPWTVPALVGAIKRSRDLRDKHRQLAQRQSIAATRRTGTKPAAANARTAEKAEIFDRALKRFEAELHELNTESTLAARELKVNARSVSAGKAAARKTAAPRKAMSKKARVALPKEAAAAKSQVGSLQSRRTRAKKSRRG